MPKKKSRLIARAEPVTIKGPLNDPSIKALPVKSAALTFGELVVAPFVFAVRSAADAARGDQAGGDRDPAVCAHYEKALKKAHEKQTGNKQLEKRDRNANQKESPFLDYEP